MQIASKMSFNAEARVLPVMNKSFLVLFFKKELFPLPAVLMIWAVAPGPLFGGLTRRWQGTGTMMLGRLADTLRTARPFIDYLATATQN